MNVRCISIVSNSKYLERLSKARYASWLNFKRIEGEGDWRDTTNLLQYERVLLCSNDLINSPSCVVRDLQALEIDIEGRNSRVG